MAALDAILRFPGEFPEEEVEVSDPWEDAVDLERLSMPPAQFVVVLPGLFLGRVVVQHGPDEAFGLLELALAHELIAGFCLPVVALSGVHLTLYAPDAACVVDHGDAGKRLRHAQRWLVSIEGWPGSGVPSMP